MVQSIGLATKKVLVVEDEQDVRDLMTLHLKREGLEVTAVENGEDALSWILGERAGKFDLLVLDWMLPGLSGLEICRKLRTSKGIGSMLPILMVTARADTTDVILGLEVGADDYITKPFELPVFLARVRALLRRSERSLEPMASAPSNGTIIEVEGLRVLLDAYEVYCSGELVQLTPSEFKLLTALLENRGRVLSRDRLISLVQGQGVIVGDRTVDTHVFGLRKKLGNCSEVIETIRGVGYRVKA